MSMDIRNSSDNHIIILHNKGNILTYTGKDVLLKKKDEVCYCLIGNRRTKKARRRHKAFMIRTKEMLEERED